MPVLPDFVVTHQWLRELRRFQNGRAYYVGVYFRLSDHDIVRVGRYNAIPQTLTAAAATACIAGQADPLGYQALVPHAVRPGAITAIRRLPQTLGWRYYPTAHGKAPLGLNCACPQCAGRGEFGSRRIRARCQDPWG